MKLNLALLFVIIWLCVQDANANSRCTLEQLNTNRTLLQLLLQNSLKAVMPSLNPVVLVLERQVVCLAATSTFGLEREASLVLLYDCSVCPGGN